MPARLIALLFLLYSSAVMADEYVHHQVENCVPREKCRSVEGVQVIGLYMNTSARIKLPLAMEETVLFLPRTSQREHPVGMDRTRPSTLRSVAAATYTACRWSMYGQVIPRSSLNGMKLI